MKLLLGCIGVAASAWADPIRIDNGRQLFVDDFLIASTNGVVRHWNTPVKHPKPVLVPTSPDGTRIASCVMATNGGLWWDPTIGRYRLWYETEWTGHLRYAESRDGLVWEFPDLGVVKGTNRVFGDADNVIDQSLDSWSVWPDYQSANPYANWKMMISPPANGFSPDTLYTSTDGRAFTKLGLAGWSCDRSTMHYDAILGKWIFSLRAHGRDGGIERCRSFWAQEKCEPAATPYSSDWCHRWHADAAHAEPWMQLQEIDYGPRGQLYNFDAVPYESVMLGALEVLHNLPGDNNEAELVGLPKMTSLRFAFSRDGRNYLPEPAEVALKPEGWGSGKWDTGYLSAMGGICTVTEDELRFYYSAMRGDGTKRFAPPNDKKPPMYRRGTYWNGAIGYATLRRDGFAGLVADGVGEIVTKSVIFSGKHLFVNVDALFGDVSAEILDAAGCPIAGFTAEDCRVIRYDDTTKRELVFAGGDLSALAGKAVSIRFRLVNATLYSFWVSPSARGESRGYVAAGGPAYPGLKDESNEPGRPRFHYTPRDGWVNDPCGLVWQKGEWHLFYQHNPTNTVWGNMHWGHAVSKDLVHWTELGEALSPDERGMIYSGSAVIDADGTAGFGKGAQVLAYTAAGDAFTQCLAYSTDGRTYVKYAGNPVIPATGPDDRDPRVFWHAPTRKWVLSLYGSENGRHVQRIFNSPDLKHWTKTSTTVGGERIKGREPDWLYECPGLEELAIEGEDRTAWVVWGAADAYAVGTFDGRAFTPEEERIPGLVTVPGSPYYAAQVFNNVPDGRKVWVAWFRIPRPKTARFNHTFSLPQELTLRRTAAGLRLVRRPARELKALRKGPAVPFAAFDGELAEVRVSCRLAPDGRLAMRWRGMDVVYEAKTERLSVAGTTVTWRLTDGRLAFTAFIDSVGIEIFSEDGLQMAPIQMATPAPDSRRLEVTEQTGVSDATFCAFPLRSIHR